MKFIRENPRDDDIMMFDFVDCADKCIRRSWRFASTCSDNLIMELSTYASCTLYCKLTAFYTYMELLTFDCMLLPSIAVSRVA